MDVLNNLQKRNSHLKSKLLHEQLRFGNYSFRGFRYEMNRISREYFHNRSLVKSSMLAGVNPKQAITWYVEGQKGNPRYRFFYLKINAINRLEHNECIAETEDTEKDYEITQHGTSWSYTTHVDGERISFISGDFESLRNMAESRNLPFDG